MAPTNNAMERRERSGYRPNLPRPPSISTERKSRGQDRKRKRKISCSRKTARSGGGDPIPFPPRSFPAASPSGAALLLHAAALRGVHYGLPRRPPPLSDHSWNSRSATAATGPHRRRRWKVVKLLDLVG